LVGPISPLFFFFCCGAFPGFFRFWLLDFFPPHLFFKAFFFFFRFFLPGVCVVFSNTRGFRAGKKTQGFTQHVFGPRPLSPNFGPPKLLGIVFPPETAQIALPQAGPPPLFFGFFFPKWFKIRGFSPYGVEPKPCFGPPPTTTPFFELSWLISHGDPDGVRGFFFFFFPFALTAQFFSLLSVAWV